MAKYVVATLNEIPPGERKIVEVAGRSIGVFNIAGAFFALRNRCPHQGGPLCEGRLSGLLEASVPGEYRYSRKGEMLRCPWHGWEFDVKTGKSWWDPERKRVQSYKVHVESGTATTLPVAAQTDGLHPPESSDEAAMSGLEKGPYTAETFAVSVEQQYVVVEIPDETAR
ncbi:Rieske (2Fe-2S) protein [Candidatus Poribacteria bacterium]|nr:Rieske (2Fe-2S) protein [Candidatus Poribacteria bacterium]